MMTTSRTADGLGSSSVMLLTDNPGWKPRRSGRGGMPGPPDCRTRPRDWAGVPVPPVPDAGAGDGVARALRAGPVRLEPGAGAGQLLRHRRPQGLPELRRAVSATDRGPGGARLAGRQTVQQQARHEGFRIVGGPAGRVRRLNRKWAEALVPKVGWVRFRLSRAIPDAKSYRVTRDSAGRWHIAFAAIPAAIPAPGTGEGVGADRGVAVAVAAALSTGELCRFDTDSLDAQVRRTQRRLCRAQRGSHRRRRVKARLARLHARRADARKDWVQKLSTDLARRFDLIRVEDLRVRHMTRSAKGTVDAPGTNVRQKAGLNRAILDKGWGVLVTRLEQKAPGRVEKVNAAYTSQR